MGRRVVSLFVVLVVGAGMASGVDLSSTWREELQSIDHQLQAEAWDVAATAARELIDEMLERSDVDPEGRGLAMASLLLAVADSGLGRDDDARWYWAIAQNYDPRFRGADLSAYGPAGERLERHRLRGVGQSPSGMLVRRMTAEMEMPGEETAPPLVSSFQRVVDGSDLAGRRVLNEDCVEVVVDTRGRVVEPVFLEAQSTPQEFFRQMEVLRGRTFESARENGRPVPVFLKLWFGSPYRLLEPLDHDSGGSLALRVAECAAIGWVSSPAPDPAELTEGDLEGLWEDARARGADTMVLRGRTADLYRCQPLRVTSVAAFPLN